MTSKHMHIQIQALIKGVVQHEDLTLKAENQLAQVSKLVRELVTDLEIARIIADRIKADPKKFESVPEPQNKDDWDYIMRQAMLTWKQGRGDASVECHVAWATLEWLRNYGDGNWRRSYE